MQGEITMMSMHEFEAIPEHRLVDVSGAGPRPYSPTGGLPGPGMQIRGAGGLPSCHFNLGETARHAGAGALQGAKRGLLGALAGAVGGGVADLAHQFVSGACAPKRRN